MRATQTFVVDLARLQMQGSDAHLVIRLMRAADDIALANWGLKHYTSEQPPLRKHIQQGARRYFVRLQCGHLVEALKLIKELRNSPRLKAVLGASEQFAQDAFERLVECLPGGARQRDFDNHIRLIRNKAAFHYDAALVAKALENRAQRPGSSRCTVTRGTEIDLWRSGLADDIEDTVVCRLLWKIPLSANLQAEADKIVEFGSSLCRDFLDVAGEVTFRYLRQTATV
ncbi:MAG: hypothetical protein MUO64_04000 [Anaerolineales bacterium]|nr:hypothetical protein [Anaerolineales bacterium]